MTRASRAHAVAAAGVMALVLAVALGGPGSTSAQTPTPTMPPGTTCEVAGVTIDCNDPNLWEPHAPNCYFLHYHGTLNGKPDPAPDGCGHGSVSSVAPPKTNWESFLDWADAAFQGLTGGFSPKTVYDTVKIVEDETPSLVATKENAEEYFETYEDAPGRPRYTLEDENPEENAPAPSIYRWFWSFFE